MPSRASQIVRRTLFRLRHPRAPEGHPPAAAPFVTEAVEREFAEMIRPFALDASAYWRFKAGCGYSADYVRYMGPALLDEKLLEHYVSLELTAQAPPGPLIDVGGAVSPFAEYAARTCGREAYRLDPGYEPGVHGDRIGAPGGAMPLPDGFASVLVLHCALDHFEGTGDTDFIREAARVLRPGGIVCSLPVYFSDRSANVCDPAHYSPSVRFDPEAEVRAVEGHSNRFGRYYAPAAFRRRILDAAPGAFRAGLHRIEGERETIPNNYLQWALTLERTQVPLAKNPARS